MFYLSAKLQINYQLSIINYQLFSVYVYISSWVRMLSNFSAERRSWNSLRMATLMLPVSQPAALMRWWAIIMAPSCRGEFLKKMFSISC